MQALSHYAATGITNQPGMPAPVSNPVKTMLELAVKANSDPWTIAGINALGGPATSLPGDILYLPSGTSTSPHPDCRLPSFRRS